MIGQFLYLGVRKLFIPGCRLTHQLTVNRSRFATTASAAAALRRAKPPEALPLLWHSPWKLVQLARRAVFLTCLFGPVLLVGVPLYILGCLSEQRLFGWLTWSLGAAGGTFIKLGQWAASRPDILPASLCDLLRRLQTDAPTHSLQWTEAVIRECFGQRLGELFSHFDPIPIGSGTIAQVHRARLKKDDSWVAVKICHPGVEEVIKLDLWLLGTFASAFHFLVPSLRWLSFPAEVSVFSAMMHEQLDLRQEALNLTRFAQNFEATGKAWGMGPVVRFPRVLSAKRRCLIEELVSDSAVPIERMFLSKDEHLKKVCAQIGFRALMQMLLWDNFVHADLHPGNIQVCFLERAPAGRLIAAFTAVKRFAQRLLTPGPLDLSADAAVPVLKRPDETDAAFMERVSAAQPPCQPQLVFLDCGLVTELSPRDFQNFTDLFKALVIDGDGRAAGRLMIERSPVEFRDCVRDPDAFCYGLSQLVEPFFSQPSRRRRLLLLNPDASSLTNLRMDLTLARLFSLCRQHHVRIDPAFTNLLMSLLCVDGLGRMMAPKMDLRPLLVEGALQYLVRVGGERWKWSFR